LPQPIRIVSIVEAWFVTGQAKNLLDVAQRGRIETEDIRPINLTLVTYERGAGERQNNQFVKAARCAGVTLDIVTEQRRFDACAIPQIRKIIDARNPDIVETNNVKSHFLMRYSGLYRERRWIAYHHGYTTTDFKMRCYNQLDRWSLRKARRVVTVCAAFSRDLKANGISPERMIVRHNCVGRFQPSGPAAISALRATLPATLREDTLILLVVGRLSREKGHAGFLEALDILRRKTKQPFHAVLVGDGPEQGRIEAMRMQLGLESYVTMAGLQHDVRPWYGIATIVVMPSHSEGSPHVLLEAMSAGVPVVASRVGGIPEIVTDEETALLVESRNAGALSAAMQRMLEDQSLRARMANCAMELAATAYSPNAYRRALAGIYEQVLAEPCGK
jgi:glycosyltransferase involved in cell wall biosynthesis